MFLFNSPFRRAYRIRLFVWYVKNETENENGNEKGRATGRIELWFEKKMDFALWIEGTIGWDTSNEANGWHTNYGMEMTEHTLSMATIPSQTHAIFSHAGEAVKETRSFTFETQQIMSFFPIRIDHFNYDWNNIIAVKTPNDRFQNASTISLFLRIYIFYPLSIIVINVNSTRTWFVHIILCEINSTATNIVLNESRCQLATFCVPHQILCSFIPKVFHFRAKTVLQWLCKIRWKASHINVVSPRMTVQFSFIKSPHFHGAHQLNSFSINWIEMNPLYYFILSFLRA